MVQDTKYVPFVPTVHLLATSRPHYYNIDLIRNKYRSSVGWVETSVRIDTIATLVVEAKFQ